ncbi:MAG: BON domain-containing protein [Pirellulales bacterium]
MRAILTDLRKPFVHAAIVAAIVLGATQASSAGDLEIARQIAEDLRSGGLKHYSVGVGSRDGVITLRGSVASDAQRQLAVSIAKGTAGVGEVVDRLQLSPAVPETTRPRLTFSQIPDVAPATKNEVPPLTAIPANARLADLPAYMAIAAVRRYLMPDTAHFDVELDDGSRIVAEAIRPLRFQLETELGTMTVPLRLVEAINRDGTENTVRVKLLNCDRITGRIALSNDDRMQLLTAHGELRVAPTAIVGLTRRGDQESSRY